MLAIHHVLNRVPQVPKSGLLLYLDALAPMSYNHTSEWRDLSGNNNHVDFYGSVIREGRFLTTQGLPSYGRTRSTLNLKPLKTITVINVSWSPIRTDGSLNGLLYEHTPDWNTVNNYNGNEYGGFGFLPNSGGSLYEQNVIHAQLRGNAEIIRGGSPYSGFNFLTPDSSVGQVYSVIHDFNDTVSAHQTKAYVNQTLSIAAETNTSTAISTNTFDNDNLFLWTRGGTMLFSDTRLGALLIYNRALSVSEIQLISTLLRKRFGL